MRGGVAAGMTEQMLEMLAIAMRLRSHSHRVVRGSGSHQAEDARDHGVHEDLLADNERPGVTLSHGESSRREESGRGGAPGCGTRDGNAAYERLTRH